MKILSFADLHIDVWQYIDRPNYNHYQRQQIQDIVKEYNPDVITISGDVVDRYVRAKEFNMNFNLYKFLNSFFFGKTESDVQIVFCLGNHEFAYSSVERTKEAFKNAEKENKDSNVHCLDIVGKYTIKDVNFVGNVLWYDGTCTVRNDASKYIKEIYDGWLDATIKNFDPIYEKTLCIEQIKNNIDENKKNVLITHMCPLYELNEHNFRDATSIFNIYSGYNNLFTDYDIYVDYAICGHTHLPVKCKHVYHDKNKEINCYNIGNDYFFRYQKTLFQVIDI